MERLLESLYDQPLLEPLTDEDLEWLAAVAELRPYAPGDYVFRAGDEPTHFYLVTQGQFERLEPVNGSVRRVQYLYPQQFFGDIELREGAVRRYSVQATLPGEVIAIPAGPFLELLAAFPQIEKYLEQTAADRLAPPRTFPGQEEDEVVIYWERRHPVELLRRLSGPVVIGLGWTLVAAIAFLLLARPGSDWQLIAMSIWAIGLIPLTLWALWEGVDWWNDLYIVTDRRVMNLERVLLLYQERREAPISKVQNVNTVRRGPVAAALNYGDVIIETAAQAGAIHFRSVPDSDVVAARILQERDKAREAQRRASESFKRRELRRALGLEPAPPPSPASGSSAATRATRFSRELATQGVRYFIPRTREQQGETVIWRKHWIVLFLQSLRPWLFLTLVFFSVVALLALQPALGPLGIFLAVLALAIAAMVGVGWLLWEYEDWHNDVYILTPSAIVDEERRPLALSKTVKQASLDQIQDVRYAIPNPLMMLLNVGNVIIQTAGTEGRLDFIFVKDPAGVQGEIFRNIQRMAEARQARESARISEEVLDLLRIYQEEVGNSAREAGDAHARG